jgi:RNA polymerase sigma factor (sigma-70 family)
MESDSGEPGCQNVTQWRRRKLKEVVTSAPPELGHDDQSSEVETRIMLQNALRRLTPAQRTVLVLRFYEDLSESETAFAIDRSTGTVKSQTHKALRALRDSSPELSDLVIRRLSDV